MIYIFLFINLCNANKTKKIQNNTSDKEKEIYCTKFTEPIEIANYINASASMDLDSLNNQRFTHFKSQNEIFEENFEELQVFLDRTSWYEPPEEKLNEIELEILDFDSVKTCFDMMGKGYTQDLIDINDTNIININQFKAAICSNNNDLPIENSKTEETKTKVSLDRNECSEVYPILQTWENELINSICSKNFLSKLKSYINEYILTNIRSYSCNISYLKRLEDISEVCIIFRKHLPKIHEYSLIFKILNEREVIEELEKMYLRFIEKRNFNKKTCKKFSTAFKQQIFFSVKSVDLRAKIDKLTDDQKMCLFYYELKKLHRYISEVPELLTLGGLFENYSLSNVTFVMHIINLFAENIGYVHDNRGFILFIIQMAFEFNYHRMFDIFKIPLYEFKYEKDLHNLTFFTWEFGNYMRGSIIRRKFKNGYYKNDFIHCKIVLLIWLYQTSIFIRYSNLEAKYFKSFQEFCIKVVLSKDCIGCLFDEYLCKVQILNKG